MSILPTYMSLYAWCPWKREEGIESPGTEVTVVSHHVGYWKFNLAPLKEESVLLTAEPALQQWSSDLSEFLF